MTSKYERMKPSKRNKTEFGKLEEIASSVEKNADDFIGCGYLRQPFQLKKHRDAHYSLKGYCAKYNCTCKRETYPPDYKKDTVCRKEAQP